MSVFGALEELRGRPIPDQGEARALKQGSRSHPIDRTSTVFAEPLKDVRLHGVSGENYYHVDRNPPYWGRVEGSIRDLVLRPSVAAKLEAVNRRIGDVGLELYLFDAWRPRALQAYFHDVWMPAELRKRHTDLSGEALTREVERYWAAPTRDASSPAPHETGAATDITLRWIGSDVLWMGSLFDDATPLAHRDRFERAKAAMAFSDEEARANRRLLHWLMAEEGFAGHPDEWWHFSWGDQMWARLTGTPAAFYGVAAP